MQRLEASLKKHGERGIEPEKWTMLGPKAPYLPYPLALEVLLIRGQVALDFGDPKAALRFFVEAQQLWASKYEVLGNSLDGWRKSRFQFDLAMPQSYRLQYFLAIANYQVGNVEESRKYSTLFEKTIGPILFGISKENHNGNLVALYLATGRPEKAIDLVSTWDPSNI